MNRKTRIIRKIAVLSAACAPLLAETAAVPAVAAETDQAAPRFPAAPVPLTRALGPLLSHAGGEAREALPESNTRVFEGRAFDTCTAPSLETMRAWKEHSPYEAAGVYVGGRARACEQENLTPEWVSEAHRMGWELIPVYVGSQAPCVTDEHKRAYLMDGKNPWAQGAREGRDAVNQAKKLGMKPGSALYLDMEAYKQNDSDCLSTTLRFVKAWNHSVKQQGYDTGFYSSADSGISHMNRARNAGETSLPETLWFARWGVPGNPDSEPYIDSGAWYPHRRIHQHEGNTKETYGGHTMNIDRNMVDAPVAVLE